MNKQRHKAVEFWVAIMILYFTHLHEVEQVLMNLQNWGFDGLLES